MKILKHALFVCSLAVLLALGTATDSWGQSLYPLFGPSSGIMVGDPATPVTTSATSANVLSLWSGTCSGSTFLNGAGACATPAGTGVTSVAQTVPAGFAIAGSPITSTGTLAISYATGQTANRVLATPDGTTGALSLRALVAGDIPPINLGSTTNGGVSSSSILLGTNGGTSNAFFSVTGPATSLKTFAFPNASATVLTTNAAVTVAQGGTSLATLTANGVMLGEGTSAPNFVVMGADTVLRGTASADPVAAAVPNCGSSSTALNYNTTTHAFGCQTISVGGTGTVTNVASGTGITGGPITSTGTLSVDQSFSPTWTGLHTFNNANPTIFITAAGSIGAEIKGTATGASNTGVFAFVDSTGTRIGYVGDSSGSNSNIGLECDTASCDIQLFPGTAGRALLPIGNPFSNGSGTTSIATNTATTIVALPATGNGHFFVSCSADSTHVAVSIVTGVSGGYSIASIQATASTSLTLSGQNVQCTQTTGGTVTAAWSIIRWGET